MIIVFSLAARIAQAVLVVFRLDSIYPENDGDGKQVNRVSASGISANACCDGICDICACRIVRLISAGVLTCLAKGCCSRQDGSDFRCTGKSSLNHAMSSPEEFDAGIVRMFAGIPALLEQAPGLIARGRRLTCECLLGSSDHPFHVSIREGRIVDLTPAPVLMRSWRFSYRATEVAWMEFWKPVPRPGWHDLLALTKRGEAALEGDLHPFMAHLQYFKDVLALPRLRGKVST